MNPLTVSDTAVTMAHVTLPQDANPAGNVHGGVILKYIDSTAGVVAIRHARGNAVTASIDRIDFLKPIFVGELVMFKASLNMVGTSSMEVGVRVECEDLFTGKVRHAASAYLTFVALDENGRPRPVPPLAVSTEEEARRNREAVNRKRMRMAVKEMERAESA